MKHFLLFVFLAVIFISSSVHADSLEETKPEEKDLDKAEDFVSLLYSGSDVPPDVPGAEPYRRCVAVRCPIKCFICICRCVRWA